MRLLLDTHSFIWWDSEPQRLSAVAIGALCNPAHEVLLSVVSLWEIVIKPQLNRLVLRLPLGEIVQHQLANGIQNLGVELEHVLAVGQMPLIHHDPFDRLLVAQAIAERATLVTCDTLVRQYPVSTLW
jgi:PIN domain nuclease of toxin-antitoxin system